MSPRNSFEHNDDRDIRFVAHLPAPPEGKRYEWEKQDDGSIMIRLAEK